MNWREQVPVRAGFWAVLLLGLFAWAPALYPGYWQGWEGFAPIYQSVSPTSLATVATSPDLWRGVGGGTYLIAQPLLRLGVDPVLAIRITFILAFVLGGTGVYAWLANRLGDRGAGLAGLAYMLSPIFLGTVYVRGSVSDAMMLALTPLALAGLASYRDRRSLAGAAVTVLSVLWMWRIQAGLAATVSVVLLLYALIVERDALVFLIASASGAAGLVGVQPLWGVASPPPVPFAENFAELHLLLDPGAGLLTSAWGVEPYQPGFIALITSVLTIWVVATRWSDVAVPLRRLIGFSLVSVLVAAFLSLSASEAFWRLTGADRLFAYPWQVMLTVAPLWVAPLAALPLLLPEMERPAYWTATVVLVVLAGLGATMPTYTQEHIGNQPVAIFGNNQLLVLSATLREQTDPPTATLEITWQPLRPLDFDYNIFFQAIVADEQGERVAAQLDVQPLGEGRPATSWRPGEVLKNSYTLDLSATSPGQRFVYYFGFYDWRDGTRLPLIAGDDKLVLYEQ
ncbi:MULTISPECIES: glycosyltransferase family protein [Caldilinea]|uniref:hypothetical protein n=1 Tax=Caldilinea TaxID=233191 RepID=UPI0013967337|nr:MULTISPECIES: hypothetical protein [Caldilinea]GIV75054.1 MAG: hypothetical protein KatS3mg049_3610 [Caldilinea sp.]